MKTGAPLCMSSISDAGSKSSRTFSGSRRPSSGTAAALTVPAREAASGTVSLPSGFPGLGRNLEQRIDLLCAATFDDEDVLFLLHDPSRFGCIRVFVSEQSTVGARKFLGLCH